MTQELPPLTLVLGGAASGKSAFAERLAAATGRRKTYLATAEAHDEEMRVKIAAHQARRGAGWVTVEAPLDLATPLAEAEPDQVVLIDCATLWLTNHLVAGHELATEKTRLIRALDACAAPVIMVSNEVGAGIVPENEMARQFRGAQGRLNQMLAGNAGLVVTVMAGLPLALKGQLPELPA